MTGLRLALMLLICTKAMSASEWSNPVVLVEKNGRLSIGNQLHVVGHIGSNLIHRRSADNGSTWTSPTTIAPANVNFPMMYSGFFCLGDTLYLLTAAGDMSSAPRQLDFRKSSDNGATWTPPIRITTAGNNIWRASIRASGNYVHIGGQGDPSQGVSWYFRSIDGGATWEPGRKLDDNLGQYGGGQTIAVDGSTVHIAATSVRNGVGAGDTYYRRSIDNGTTWSDRVIIGEETSSSNRQARVQFEAVDGHVFVSWQREANMTGNPVPPDRIGYNRSGNGGATWGVPQILLEDTGIDRNHPLPWMTSGGGLHMIWKHGDNSAVNALGYVYSPDYGATWYPREIAIDTNEMNHPYAVCADANRVHVLSGPLGAMKYSHRNIIAAGFPMITTQPINTSVAANQTATFTATASGTPMPTFQWQSDPAAGGFTNISGATSASYTTPVTTLAQSGRRFRVIATNNAGTAISAAATLTVTAVTVAPTIITQPANVYVVDGQTAIFTAVASGSPAPTFQWQSASATGAFTNISGATSASYAVPTVTLAQNGRRFQVIATNSAGTVTSSVATLAVTAATMAPTISEQPIAQTVLCGQPATFMVSAIGAPEPSFQWQRSNDGAIWNPIAGSTGSTYTIPVTVVGDHGAKFRCVATNLAGMATSVAVTLTVNAVDTGSNSGGSNGGGSSSGGGGGCGLGGVVALLGAACALMGRRRR